MLKLKKITVENLEKFYKYVHTCENCKRKYGCDVMEESFNLCPICCFKNSNKKSILERIGVEVQ